MSMRKSLFKPEIPFKYNNVISSQTMEKTIKNNSPSSKHRYYLRNNPSDPKKENSHSKKRIKVTVIGHRTSKEFIYCYHLVKGICKYRSQEYEEPVIKGVTDAEWLVIWQNLKQYGPKVFCSVINVAVFVNDDLIGGENELKKFVESKYVYRLCLDYCKEGVEQLRKYIALSGRPCAYMQISIDGEEIGTLLFMLYADLVPRTCENFLRLCETTKGGYPGTPVHRIVKDCWIQCGGFGLKDTAELRCENFLVPHDRRGVLCMANNGRDVDCSTQFFVLLQPAPWMKHKYVAFGQLIEGEKTLSKIENVPTWYESPTQDVVIYKAGVLNMECQYKPINKNTNEYLQGHVEDLIALGKFLYEELMRKVFGTLSLPTPYQSLEEVSVNNNKSTETDTANTLNSDENNVNIDFDVETYDNEYQIPSSHTSELSGIIIEKPFHIPLTDVPYEGEVDSQYDLKRLLKGDYCYENDLESISKIKITTNYQSGRLSIPQALVAEVFECYALDDSSSTSDTSSDSSKSKIYNDYVRQYMGSVSFAGHVVKNIANVTKKFEIFDRFKEDDVVQRLLTDEELRIIRMAKKEYRMRQPKQVSISLLGSKISHSRIIRRPTGFVFPEDIAELGINVQTYEEEDQKFIPAETEGQVTYLESSSDIALQKKTYNRNESTFLQLMESVVKHSKEDPVPTLKNYKSSLPEPKSGVDLISFSATYHLTGAEPFRTESDWKLPRAFGVCKDIHRAQRIEHGIRLLRKTSAISNKSTVFDHEKKTSISAVEFARKRPVISVDDYKMKNRQYRKTLNSKIDTPTKVQ